MSAAAESQMRELRGFPEIEVRPDDSRIREENREPGKRAYGGSQKWFSRHWARLAGCASVSASNLAAFFRIGVEPDRMEGDVPVYRLETWLKLQKDMYRRMRPGIKGFPHVSTYLERFQHYAGEHGWSLQPETICGWTSAEEPWQFVRRAIEEGQPLALLVLGHTAPEIDEDTWHWMTITGWGENPARILLSNYGNRQVMDADILLRPDPRNEVRLIRLNPCRTAGEASERTSDKAG